MATITIPKKFAEKDDLILIPRKEYEALLLQHKSIKEFTPTLAQKKALAKARSDMKNKKTFSYSELVSKMGFAN